MIYSIKLQFIRSRKILVKRSGTEDCQAGEAYIINSKAYIVPPTDNLLYFKVTNETDGRTT